MSDDILTLLRRDHEAAESLLQRFDSLGARDRDEYFCEVVHTLVGHEVAEEIVLYPAVRDDGPEGERVAEARLAEQSQAEKLLANMEHDDTSTAAFVTNFTALRRAVLEHAKAEEATVFPLLESSTTSQDRQELGTRYAKAKDRAPTHPHPHAPDTSPANKILGPVAAMFDRARDAVHK